MPLDFKISSRCRGIVAGLVPATLIVVLTPRYPTRVRGAGASPATDVGT